jgi:hypothetical protein
MPDVAGSWEFIATSSSTPGYSTGVEVALQEGQILDTATGGYDYTGQISASGTQLSFVGINSEGVNAAPDIVFGGNCTLVAGNSLTGSITGVGGSMDFTFTENGSVYSVTAVLDASGQSIDSGTYTLQSGDGCDGDTGGTITSGKIVPKLSGTYTGQICQPSDSSCESGAIDGATATLGQSGTTLTINMVLTGADNATFTLTGPVTGNAFSVQGTFEGTSVAYYGYYETLTETIEGVPTSVPALYLVNTATASLQAGLLTVPQTP